MNEPVKDPRIGDTPHPGVDDPTKKPPVEDPEIRKGPLKDPPTSPPTIDPPAEPHVPGDPAPEVGDPALPGEAPKEPGMLV